MFDSYMLSFVAVLLGSTLLAGAGSDVSANRDGVPSDTVITMIYGGCEHRCQVFDVVIFGDGTVIVDGQYYLRHPALATSEIPGTEVKRLVEHFRAIDYFNLPDDFGYHGKGCTSVRRGDARNVTTTIVSGGRGRSIIHYRGCEGPTSDQLTALEKEITRVANVAKWIEP